MSLSNHARRFTVAPIALGALVAVLVFTLDGHFGSVLGDEGYLWYGVQRVFAGEFPVRDFMSYEIGRYYLSAGVMGLFHDQGILALRANLALWTALGVSLAVSLVAEAWNERRWPWLVMPALTFGIWMAPRHKVFDIVVSIVLVGVVARVIERPFTRRWFWLGLATGGAALIGQNHGAYALVVSAFVFLLFLVASRRDVNWIRDPATWGAGVVVGYLPVICFALFVPGYSTASIGALKFILIEYKGTNLPLPTPWPWHVSLAAFRLQPFVAGLLFLALPVLVTICMAWTVHQAARGSVRHHPVFVAAVLVAIPYMHVAFSRADTSHLAQAIAPALLMALTWPEVAPGRDWWPRLLRPAILTLFCLVGAAQLHPRFQYHYGGLWQSVAIGKDQLKIDADSANLLVSVQHAREKYGLVQGSVLSVPLTPGLSAALGEKNPLWEIYPLFPRSQVFQQAEIARLAAQPAALVVVSSAQLDGRADLAYSATHPEVYRYILDHYQAVPVAGARPDLQFYIARRNPAGG